MATTKRKGRRANFNETRYRKRKPDPKHPPYDDIIEGAFHDPEHELGFTRDKIRKYLLAKYGTLEKKPATLNINAAIRNGIKNGTLQQLSGTGISGTFRLVETKTKPSTKDSKRKHPNREIASTSRVDTPPLLGKAQATKSSDTDTMKTYHLRKRNQMSTKKTTKALMTRKSTSMKMRGDVAKKLAASQDRKATPLKTGTSDPKQTTIREAKGSTSDLSVADTADSKPTLPERLNPKTTLFSGSVMDKTVVNQTSSDVCSSLNESELGTNDPNSILESPQASVLEGISASRAHGSWPFTGVKPKRSVPIDLEHVARSDVGGMVVLSDGRMLIADEVTLKLYSPEINPLSCLTFTVSGNFGATIQEKIQDIAIFSETVAIVLLHGVFPEIQSIDYSTETLSVGQSLNLWEHYLPKRITACRGNIFLTCRSLPNSFFVKKMDIYGKVYWSVSNEKFFNIYCIESFVVDNSVRLVVTCAGSFAYISVLDGDSGDILFSRQGQNCMFGLATDVFNNIYIFNSCNWVSVMTNDLSEERMILTSPMFTTKYNALAHDLDFSSKRMAFDRKSNSLLVVSGPEINNASTMLQIYQFY